ncbi:methyltransferase [Acetatifactor muris]|uniref:methyltransferase n=1 Tax=Acetatifactor muris TaxID=879566 RepID=UPI0023F3A29A|nr:methyltransferase [Acetatifactor muris]
MDSINYLAEAVYFFQKFISCVNNDEPLKLSTQAFRELKINESIYKATMRILVVNNMIDFDGKCYVMTSEHSKNHKCILEDLDSKNQIKKYEALYTRTVDESGFFFDRISELEYEIYSRCNFSVTYERGKEIAGYLDLTNKTILELGGNSGGLGAAFLSRYEDCSYFILDTRIPCEIGNEFKELYGTDVTFIEGNVFEMEVPSQNYDYILMMNLLHDFDDERCCEILKNCLKYCSPHTKFVIIEDILTNEYEPKEVILHGLRLSIECMGGKQRTIEEFKEMFSGINYTLEEVIRLNEIHTMLVICSWLPADTRV